VKNVISGVTYPSFSDTFNVNPASLPVTLTPVGVEAIASTAGSRSGSNINFALIKGFKAYGFGLANNSDNTFYSYNLVQALKNTSYGNIINNFVAANALRSSINLGAAVAPFRGKMFNFVSIPTLGIDLRYNRLTNNWDPQLGASFNASYFNFGASYTKSARGHGNTVPAMSTTSLTAGAKVGVLAAEYTVFYLGTSDPSLASLPLYSRPTQILTGSLGLSRFHFTAAYRKSYNVNANPVYLTLVAFQIELLKKLSLAFQRNYLPGASSLSLQVLL
ncbi:MAG: hypothetical protein ACXWQJ_18395, partial [Bdellovibrionota bacterium]